MGVCGNKLWRVELQNMTDVANVKTTGRDVSGEKHSEPRIGKERVIVFDLRFLRLLAVEAIDSHLLVR